MSILKQKSSYTKRGYINDIYKVKRCSICMRLQRCNLWAMPLLDM